MNIDVKYEREAALRNLVIVGKGKNSRYRKYRFIKCNHEQEIRTDLVREKEIKCNCCFELKIMEEAKSAGVTIVGDGLKDGYREYMFNECCHRQQLSLRNVRKKQIQCKTCENEKIKKEAFEAGLVFIEKINKHRNLYKIKKCNHFLETTRQTIRRNAYKEIKCKECMIEELIVIAKKHNLKIIDKPHRAGYRWYRCNICTNELEVSNTCIRNNSFCCEGCFKDKIIKEATKQGLEFVGKHKTRGKGIYKLPCGHTKDIFFHNVRNGIFKCELCDEERYTNEAIMAGLTMLKKTNNKEYRLYRFNECGHERVLRISHVRNKNFKCEECHELKLMEEANKNDLIYIGKCKCNGSSKRKYKFKECGHIKDLRTDDVKKGNFRCEKCKGVYLINGLLVASSLEKKVGDWLINNGIEFEYDILLSSKSKHRTDFYLPKFDLYIEVLGFDDNFKGYMDDFYKKEAIYYNDKNLFKITRTDIMGNNWENNLSKILNIHK